MSNHDPYSDFRARNKVGTVLFWDERHSTFSHKCDCPGSPLAG